MPTDRVHGEGKLRDFFDTVRRQPDHHGGGRHGEGGGTHLALGPAPWVGSTGDGGAFHRKGHRGGSYGLPINNGGSKNNGGVGSTSSAPHQQLLAIRMQYEQLVGKRAVSSQGLVGGGGGPHQGGRSSKERVAKGSGADLTSSMASSTMPRKPTTITRSISKGGGGGAHSRGGKNNTLQAAVTSLRDVRDPRIQEWAAGVVRAAAAPVGSAPNLLWKSTTAANSPMTRSLGRSPPSPVAPSHLLPPIPMPIAAARGPPINSKKTPLPAAAARSPPVAGVPPPASLPRVRPSNHGNESVTHPDGSIPVRVGASSMGGGSNNKENPKKHKQQGNPPNHDNVDAAANILNATQTQERPLVVESTKVHALPPLRLEDPTTTTTGMPNVPNAEPTPADPPVQRSPTPDGHVRCSHCQRAFNEDRIQKHQTICNAINNNSRVPLDMKKIRELHIQNLKHAQN